MHFGSFMRVYERNSVDTIANGQLTDYATPKIISKNCLKQGQKTTFQFNLIFNIFNGFNEIYKNNQKIYYFIIMHQIIDDWNQRIFDRNI